MKTNGIPAPRSDYYSDINHVMIKLGRAARLWNIMELVYAATNGGMGQDFKTKLKWLANKRTEQACRWGFKSFICEMRLRKYKSTLIDKGLNYFVSVKLLILETIVSQRPWSYYHYSLLLLFLFNIFSLHF